MNYKFLFGLMLFSIGLIANATNKGHIKSGSDEKINAAFDIVYTEVRSEGDDILFRVQARGKVGVTKPKAIGKFASSSVYSYVWPTNLNSANVGFEDSQGILALAVTFHPDFDDGAYGKSNRTKWHPHWIVLTPDEACGNGALKVRDIPQGTTPKLPATWPNVPLLIDSPNYPTKLAGNVVEVKVPTKSIGAIAEMKFDGVTSALKVNANLHAPLLCISNVFDIASGDLSLSGTVTP